MGEVILSGIVTGFYIGFGGVLCSTVGGSALGLAPGLQRFLFGAVGFPLSIFLTTIAGGQGFTPNVAVMASAVLRKGSADEDKSIKFETMFKNLVYAYIGNAIGLITIAFLANLGNLPAVPASIIIAKHKVFDYSASAILFRGILGGWLIGLAVWTSQAAESVSAKFVTIWLCISTYVICQYEHCLANLFFVPCAIFAGAKITWGQFIMQNLIPTTIGNFIGGFLMLAGSYRLVYGKHGVIKAPA
jgi:formate/nitrite transporter